MELCVALDMETKDQNLKLVKELKGLDLWLKVGLRSYLRDGINIIEQLKKYDFKVFLDLKIHDIPNTMANACEVIAKSGADMINLHASSGTRAMDMVMNRLNNLKNRPLVLGVSALTSFDNESFKEIYGLDIKEAVVKFAKFANDSGLDGMVSSVYESLAIKSATRDNFLTLTPGIRPFGETNNDQKRVADLNTAIQNKSDFIVVGRPIYNAKNPKEISEKILEKIK